MRRSPSGLLTAIAIVVAIVLGVAIVGLEARSRVDAVLAAADRVADTQTVAVDFMRSNYTQPSVMRAVIVEAVMNDAMPTFVVDGEGASVSVRYGAFGTGSYLPTVPRPWSMPLAAAPLALALVLGITAMLVAASRWTPRPSTRGGPDVRPVAALARPPLDGPAERHRNA
jgi:hypothetical protein